MRCAIYARVSTFDQEPENQLQELRRFVEARGWTATEYIDRGISGAKDRRPALDHLIGDVKRRRFDVVPGLTGLWQVSGKNRTTFNEMIGFDVEYSKKASLLLDIKIILKTLPALWAQCMDARAAKTNLGSKASGEITKSVQH